MCLVANFTGNYELKYVIIEALQQQGFSVCRKTFGTLLDFEKGSYIFRSYNRRRTKVRQSVRTEKASKHKAFSMFALCFFFCIFYIFNLLLFIFSFFTLAVEQLFLQSEKPCNSRAFGLFILCLSVFDRFN